MSIELANFRETLYVLADMTQYKRPALALAAYSNHIMLYEGGEFDARLMLG